MTTPNTDMQEQIARELVHLYEDGRAWEQLSTFAQNAYMTDAAAFLFIVEQAVQRGQAEALREMQEHHEREADKAQTITARSVHLTIADGARKRADEYETGGRA